MKTRVISALGLIAFIFFMLFILGSHGGLLLLLLLSSLSQWECYTLLERTGAKPLKPFGIVLGAGLLIGSYSSIGTHGVEVFAICVLLLSVSMLQYPNFSQVFLPTLAGIAYIPFMLQFFGFLLELNGTLFLPIWVIFVAKFSDIGAFLVGSKFGRRKLAPNISPGKTMEGALGGVLTSLAIGLLLIFIFGSRYAAEFGILKAAFTAICIGTVAIISDLIESIIKRQAGVKDSGKLIPGIGGAFDLADSLLLSAPVGYLLIRYLL